MDEEQTDRPEWVGHNKGHNKQADLVVGRKRTNQQKEGAIGTKTNKKSGLRPTQCKQRPSFMKR